METNQIIAESRLTAWIRSLSPEQIAAGLSVQRWAEDFVAHLLPFVVPDGPADEIVRYHLGDEWIDFLVLDDNGSQREVQVIATSCPELGLWDVADDIRTQLHVRAGVEAVPVASPSQGGNAPTHACQTVSAAPDLSVLLDRIETLIACVLWPVVKDTYTVEEVADRTRYGRWTLRQACNKGVITAEKVNDQWRIPHAEMVRIENQGIGRI
jgi:hypothetical protein